MIAGNWKMHMTCAQAKQYAAAFLPQVANAPKDRSIVLAPPFTAISTLQEALAGSDVQIASQNVHWEASGAFTGEISAEMLLELGVGYQSWATASRANTSLRVTSRSTNGLAPPKPLA